jgi:hypothetical protein
MQISAIKYDELVRLSTKGDKKASDELFAYGGESLIENNPVTAAEAFKDAAISYRISVFRTGAEFETSQKKAHQLMEDVDIFREWILAFPNGRIAIPKVIAGLDQKAIETAIYGAVVEDRWKTSCRGQLPVDLVFSPIYCFLDSALEKSNEDFARLNGNRPLYVTEMLFSYFGVPSRRDLNLINATIDVRVGIDLLARKIEERFSGQQK